MRFNQPVIYQTSYKDKNNLTKAVKLWWVKRKDEVV